MKDIILGLIILTLMFIAGCVGMGDLPPAPGDIGVPVGKATGPYAGFSNGDAIIMLQDPVDASSGSANLNVEVEDEFVWGYGYYLSKSSCKDPNDWLTCQWKKFSYNGTKYTGSNWIDSLGTATLQIDSTEFFNGKNVVLAYTCRSTGSSFDCNNNQWLIKEFTVNFGNATPGMRTLQDGGIINEQETVIIETLSGTRQYLVSIGPLVGVATPGQFALEYEVSNTYDEANGQYFGVVEPSASEPSNMVLLGGDGYGAIVEIMPGDNLDSEVELYVRQILQPPTTLGCSFAEYFHFGVEGKLDIDGDGAIDHEISLQGGDWQNNEPDFSIDGENTGFMPLLSEFTSTTGVRIKPLNVNDMTVYDRGRMVVAACLEFGAAPKPIPTYQQEGEIEDESEAFIEVAGWRFWIKSTDRVGDTVKILYEVNNSFNTATGEVRVRENPSGSSTGYYMPRTGLPGVIEIKPGNTTDNKVVLGINTLAPPPNTFGCSGEGKEYILVGETRLFDNRLFNVDLKLINASEATQEAEYRFENKQEKLTSGETIVLGANQKIVHENVFDLSWISGGGLVSGFCISSN